ALRDFERMMEGQGDDTDPDFEPLRPLTRRRQKHFGRADHFPAARMVFATPELVVAELVQELDKVEIAAELQHRMLADRMMRSEKGAEIQTRHDQSPIAE